jgi:hypothetical protein
MNSLLHFWRPTLTSLVLITPQWVANYDYYVLASWLLGGRQV